ncbi:uncharacterized protein LOC124120234 [Haliotis rufescens]|uniref:uncharacterized protein LOC124120234 n=1 Tax=Haliotis rufescens TaxID=6454 RepID=UPI00201F7288|nr:uncharacterized protein LOC124120234 [Haliotis rufescens]
MDTTWFQSSMQSMFQQPASSYTAPPVPLVCDTLSALSAHLVLSVPPVKAELGDALCLPSVRHLLRCAVEVDPPDRRRSCSPQSDTVESAALTPQRAQRAHSLLDDIFSIGTQDATVEQHAQLNLFLSKLTGTSVGFTAIDFFVIKKEFILTLSGLFVTYFFLLLQFKIA